MNTHGLIRCDMPMDVDINLEGGSARTGCTALVEELSRGRTVVPRIFQRRADSARRRHSFVLQAVQVQYLVFREKVFEQKYGRIDREDLRVKIGKCEIMKSWQSARCKHWSRQAKT
jgi:hypothetical protein